MSERAPYSRVYWSVRNDPRLLSIYPDDHHWATWNRLLLAADMAWPAPADLPSSARPASVKALEQAGVIQLLPGGLFIFHGLDSERGKRSETGRGAAASRWQSERNADAVRTHTERTASRAEQSNSKAEQSNGHAPTDGLPNLSATVAGIWETATGRSVLASGAYSAEYLDDACRRHPASEVGAAVIRARKGFDHIPDGPALIAAMRPLLDPFPDGKKASKEDGEREARERSRRAVEATLIANHKVGGHESERHPRCPNCQSSEVV